MNDRSALQPGYVLSAMIFLLASANSSAEAVPPVPLEYQQVESPDAAVTKLSRPGNDIFSAIQEALHKLESDPATDWKKVNLEALRQHLLDMRCITEDVEVISQKPIDKGVEIMVRATRPGAVPALDRAFNTHPKVLKSEIGWDMTATKDNDKYKLRVTTDDATQVEKLRGLGYIGVMAMGNHHAALHWALARGQAPR